jgi:hypothetical protein
VDYLELVINQISLSRHKVSVLYYIDGVYVYIVYGDDTTDNRLVLPLRKICNAYIHRSKVYIHHIHILYC